MLDGNRYFAEFPDEEPAGFRRLTSSPELLTVLMAIEREISGFILGAVAGERGKSADG